MGIWNGYVDFIEWALREISTYTGSVGLAIIVFTIFLKTLMLPLTVKSIRSTAAMQELQPKIKELQKKHSKDRQKVTEETMKLYQEYQINPAAGCFPMLLQIPIFFGLYFAVRHISDDGGSFLWIPNLGEADPYFILPIAAGVFQFIQTKMMRPHNAPKASDPQQQMMNTMMNFMPLMVVFFGWTFAAGAVLYWATQSVYSVVQQWFITGWGSMKNWFPWLPEMQEHRRLGYRKPVERVEVGEYQPKGFMGMMQRRMKEMEERQRVAAEARGKPQAPSSSAGSSSSSSRKKSKAQPSANEESVPKVSGAAPPVDPTASRVMTGRSRSSAQNDRSGR